MLLSAGVAAAQELAPRAYWPLPAGTNVVVAGYQLNTGDILIDPSLPVTGVESDINYFQLTYQRSLNILGRSASVQFSQPYANGVTEGFVEGDFKRRRNSGLTDARVRLAMNLVGAPAMNRAEFKNLRENPQTIVGASLLIQAPTGKYDSDRLLNLGTNRWSIKPALGVIMPLHPTWLLEFEMGAWFFGDNDDFLGMTRKQDPIASAEVHLIKRISPGFWASLDANYYRGGETQIGNDFKDDLQRNARVGFTAVIPIADGHAVRGSFSTGLKTRAGGDFELYGVSYLFAW